MKRHAAAKILALLLGALFAALPAGAQDRVERARKLLAEAGYPDGRGFPKLEVLYNTDEGHKKIAAALQLMWRRNLGIDVELRNTEWKIYLDDMSKLRYQVARRGWTGDYNDPNTFLEMFTSWSGNNNTGWASAEYDGLIRRAAAEADPAKRPGHFRRAEEILMREMPVLPLYFYSTQNCWKENVRGLFQNVLDVHPLHEVVAEGREVLVINNGAEAQTLDPTLARGVLEFRVLIGLFEGLTAYDPRTLAPVPGVAERWDISPDGKRYTFHLRDCAWTDGRPVTAQDFVYSWTRVLNPATPTDYAHQLYYLRGAEAYNTRKTADPSTVGVRADGDRTLIVDLENPCAFFLDLCAFGTYYPVPRDAIERHGARWTRPENMISNGPFFLHDHRLNDSITLRKNPRYWDAARVRQPEIRFLSIENRATAWNLYRDGQCDFVTSLPLEHIRAIMERPDFHGGDYLGTYFYSFNVTKGALKDRRVRLALALAVDRETIVTKITRQGQTPAYHFTPPAWPGYAGPRFDTLE